MLSKTLTKALLFAVGLTANIPFNFYGILRVGEIILFVIFLMTITKCIDIVKNVPFFRKFTFLFLLTVLLSTVSTFFNANGWLPFFKGISNYILMFTTLVCLFHLLHNKPNLILFYFLGLAISSFFINPYEILKDSDIPITAENTQYFDVKIVPVAMPLLVFISLLTFRYKQYFLCLIFLLFGIISVLNEARSIGLIFIFASITIILKIFKWIPSFKSFVMAILLGPLIIFPLLSSLTQSGSLGEKSSSYTTKVIKHTKEFNPFLVIGRPDPIVGLIAFVDKPILGHGYNSSNELYKNIARLLGFLPSKFKFDTKTAIPSHSVIIGSIVEGGILCIFLWIYILFHSIKAFHLILKRKNEPLAFFVILIFFSILWNLFFSPVGYIRLSFPYEFVIIIIILYSNDFISKVKSNMSLAR